MSRLFGLFFELVVFGSFAFFLIGGGDPNITPVQECESDGNSKVQMLLSLSSGLLGEYKILVSSTAFGEGLHFGAMLCKPPGTFEPHGVGGCIIQLTI